MLLSVMVLSACAPAIEPDAARVYRMGDRVQVGALVYNVFEDHWKAQLGDGVDARVPKDRILLLRLSIVNSGSSEAMVPTLNLVDDSGQAYAEQANGDQVPQWLGYLRRVKPAENLQGNVAFDVPPKHYILRVGDENSQKTRNIDIPLNFTSDMPELPTARQ